MKLLPRRREALEEAYEKYADMLFRLALTHTGSREDAEDALHDVFIKYSDHSKPFRDSDHEKAWLIRVCINRCHDLVRKRSVRTHLSLDDISEISEDNANGDEIKELMNSLSMLAEKYRIAVILHYLEGYSVNETADILKISVSAVKMRLARARELLKTELGNEVL